MIKIHFIWLVLLFAIVSCNQTKKAEYQPPVKLNDGWEVSTPGEQGFDQEKVEKLVSEIPEKNSKLDALVIVRNGKLVVDQYFNDYGPDKPHKIWSITKAISGTALGIAIDNYKIKVTDSIYSHLGNYNFDSDTNKRAITVEHLITMTSGLEWEELGGPGSIGFQLPYSTDWIAFTLSQKLVRTPGELFNYSTGNSMVLAAILKNVTGEQVRDFAKKHLFDPLEIKNYEWDKQSEFWSKTQGQELPGAKKPPEIKYQTPFSEYTNTGSGLWMRPRDICKIGQLYLRGGQWNGNQIVSKKWIQASVKPHFGNDHYGYHWRLMNFKGNECYYATGFGLQRIFVFSELDLVVTILQHHYETMPKGNQLTKQLLEEIIASITS